MAGLLLKGLASTSLARIFVCIDIPSCVRLPSPFFGGRIEGGVTPQSGPFPVRISDAHAMGRVAPLMIPTRL